MGIEDAFRRFRKTFGVTQKQAAIIAGVSERGWQMYEYGTATPSVDVIVALSANYNVSADYLLGLSDNPEINR